MRRSILALLGVGLLATAHAQQPPPAQAPRAAAALTALDYYEIEQLSARYAHGMDTGAAEGRMAAGVFTPDGLLIDGGGRRAEGRPAIAALARQDPESRKGPTNVSELVANLVVEPSDGGAVAHSYVLFAAKPLPGQPRGVVTSGGRYRDDLVRTPEGWRVRRRVFVRAGAAPPGLPPLGGTPSSAAARAAAGGPGLTAEEFAGIQRLYADYGHTFDTGSEDGYGWANLYTADGVHVNVVNSLEYIKGRDLLAAFAFGAYRVSGGFATFNRAQGPTKTPLSAAHIQTSILLEPTRDGVVAKPYRLTGALDAGDRVTLTPGGVYYDLLTKDAERWRFAASWYLLPGLKVPDAIARFVSPVAFEAYMAPVGSTSDAGGLTAEDQVEIHQLYARAAQAFDSAADEGAAFAELFTERGAFTDASGATHTGRSALAALAGGRGAMGKGRAHVEEFVWQIRIDPASRRVARPVDVESRAYVVRLDLEAEPPTVLNGGQYRDRLVKTSGGWRIQSRVFRRVERNQPVLSR
jgi:hypothetical protein